MQTNYNKKRKYNNVITYKKQRSRPKKKWVPIKRNITAEVKAVDTVFPFQDGYSYFRGSPAQVPYALNVLYKGVSNFNRIGNKINLKSLQISGYIRKYNYQSNLEPTKLRILIVYDKQPNGALPQLNEVLRTINILGAAVTTGNSLINLSDRNRFEIIKDINVAMGGYSVVTTYDVPTSQNERLINCYIKLKGRPTIYNIETNSGGIGDIKSGALYIYTIDNNFNNNGEWCFDAAMRLRFWDS